MSRSRGSSGASGAIAAKVSTSAVNGAAALDRRFQRRCGDGQRHLGLRRLLDAIWRRDILPSPRLLLERQPASPALSARGRRRPSPRGRGAAACSTSPSFWLMRDRVDRDLSVDAWPGLAERRDRRLELGDLLVSACTAAPSPAAPVRRRSSARRHRPSPGRARHDSAFTPAERSPTDCDSAAVSPPGACLHGVDISAFSAANLGLQRGDVLVVAGRRTRSRPARAARRQIAARRRRPA